MKLWERLKSDVTRTVKSAVKVSPQMQQAVRSTFSNRTLLEAIDTAKSAFSGSVRGTFNRNIEKTPEAQSAGRSIVAAQFAQFTKSPGAMLAGVVIIGTMILLSLATLSRGR